jgi:hypothetical protein
MCHREAGKVRLDRTRAPLITAVPGFGMNVILHILPEEDDVRWDEEGWADTYLALARDLKIEVTSDLGGISVNVRVAFDDDVRGILSHAVNRINTANDQWIAERTKRARARDEAETWWREQSLDLVGAS